MFTSCIIFIVDEDFSDFSFAVDYLKLHRYVFRDALLLLSKSIALLLVFISVFDSTPLNLIT